MKSINTKMISDIHVITFCNFDISSDTQVNCSYDKSPNKFFDYITGLPSVLNNYPGWLANIVNETNSGFVLAPQNAEVFAHTLGQARENRQHLPIKSKNAKNFPMRDLIEKNYSLDLVKILENTYN